MWDKQKVKVSTVTREQGRKAKGHDESEAKRIGYLRNYQSMPIVKEDSVWEGSRSLSNLEIITDFTSGMLVK